ncbi:hypothetical protein CDAR_28931 [Caerostris darwini]|uniref:Secreted protein n=1 Tax=Caerostris darwini TaxID=1538125 RepID=A0AAV4N7R0_9ARAC|nr:hypothetical protein CDAR_28931 [Caerostris darwini]
MPRPLFFCLCQLSVRNFNRKGKKIIKEELTRSIPAHVSQHEKRPNLNSTFIPQTYTRRQQCQTMPKRSKKEQYRTLAGNRDGKLVREHLMMTCCSRSLLSK